ncbi:MAG: peptidylprolyl isomerase [Candidatus Acidiferrales bacterium]
MKIISMRTLSVPLALAAILIIGARAHGQEKPRSVIVEEIVARVNNSIITLSEFQKADTQLKEEIQRDCQGCTADKMEGMYRDRQKDLLRDLIDQQLLVQRAKDEGISVETDVIKRLDDVRKQNNLQSLDDLEKAVEGEGISWEDYKAQIRNSLLTQEVIGKEMRGRILIGDDEVKKFYEEHQKEFIRPEQVVLREIFLSTEKATPEEAGVIERKAQDYLSRLKRGEDFAEMAKRYSDGSTAKDGGDLGAFERGQLSKQIADATFALDKGGLTDVIETKTGIEIIKVVDHYHAGLQPLEKVRATIENEIYMKKMQPTLREYLAQLREESYVTVKPGFTDSAAMPGASIIQEVAPTPDAPTKGGKKKLPRPKAGR